MSVSAEAKPIEQTIRAVIIRKDGTTQDLGIVSYYHRNPLKRLYFRILKFLKGF